MLFPLSKLYSVAKLSPAQSNFNPVGWAELALISISTYPPTSTPRFVQPSFTVEKWSSDICPSNICPSIICLGNICPGYDCNLSRGFWYLRCYLSPNWNKLKQLHQETFTLKFVHKHSFSKHLTFSILLLSQISILYKFNLHYFKLQNNYI